MSTANRWLKIEAVFEAALEQTGKARVRFLDSVCGNDRELREKVETLLRADLRASGFLSTSNDANGSGRLSVGHIRPPEWVGPYRIVGLIGRGGMGTVWLAERQRDFRKTVAIKILDRIAPSNESVERFRKEREILSRLEHENIARLYDGGLDRKVGLYIVMEYVGGLPIDEYCKANRKTLTDRLELFIQACQAVSFAHRNLIVHRDLKPSNILVTSQGSVKLLDFGIAKWIDPGRASNRVTGLAMTPAYASPEQIQGKPVTTSTDVYSLGAVLYEILTGIRPFDADRDSRRALAFTIVETIPQYPSEVVRRNLASTPISPRALRGDIDRIVLKALSKSPGDRYKSADDMLEDIRLHLEGRPITVKSRRSGYVLRKFVKRNRAAVSVTAAVLLLTAMSIGFWIDSMNRYRAEKAAADGLSSFLTDLFEIADPSLRSDTAITASDILRLGRDRASKRLGYDQEEFAEFMGLIGNLYTKIGEFEVAQEVHKRALQTLPHDVSHARTRNLLGLGVAEFQLGNFDAADSLMSKAFEEQTRTGPESGQLTVDILAAKSELAVERDELDLADSLISRAMLVQARSKTTENSKKAELLTRRGSVLIHRGHLREAEFVFRRALELYKADTTEQSVEIASVFNNLGVTYSKLGYFEKANASFEKSLQIYRRRLGESHPRLGIVLANMAMPIAEIFGPDSAYHLSRMAISILKESKGAAHPDVGWALHRLGVRMRMSGDLASAESLYTQAIRTGERVFGRNHVFISGWRHDLAIVQRIQQKKEAALKTYKKAIDGYVNTGRRDLRRSDALNGMGKIQRDLGMTEEAIASFRESLEIRQRLLEPDHWRLGTAHSFLGEALGIAGYHEEAEPHLMKGIEILEVARGPDDPKTEDARKRLRELRNRTSSQRDQVQVAEKGSE